MEQIINAKKLRQIVADSVQQALDGARIDPTDSSWNWIASERLSFLKLIDSMSVADTNVDPLWHGHWIRLNGDSRFMCSVCKWKENVPTCNGEPTIWDYCPSCGARMDGREDD